jgi:hypothetical protein
MHTNALVLGSIVTYRDTPYMAVGYDGAMVKLIAPNRGNAKLNVARRNVTVTSYKATVVEFKGKQHLVTKHRTIVSMVSLRVLKNTTPDALMVIKLAGATH